MPQLPALHASSFAGKGMPWQFCWLTDAVNGKLQTHGGKQNEVT